MRRVTLFGKPGCHLCEDARAAILEVRQRHPFAFEEVDIERDDDLLRDYGIRIPVVAVDGEEVFELEVDRAALAALVRS
jgi:glutaredoxin